MRFEFFGWRHRKPMLVGSVGIVAGLAIVVGLAIVAVGARGAAAPDKTRASDGKAPFEFSAQLDRAGASACRTQLNALAVSTMGSVETFNTVSSWSQAAGDKRAVSIAIGQKYPDGSAVPFGASEIIATPNQQGSCDGFSVQIIPSPTSCTKLRESMTTQRGQQLGDLAGISVMQDNGGGRTMLVPTKADTCVLVATRTSYAK